MPRGCLIVVLLVVASGCLAEQDGPTSSPSPSPTPEASFVCVHAKSFRLDDINITILTSRGAIGAVLHGGRAPITVCNFLRYVEENFHDQTIWHRICQHVIQAGGYDPYAIPGQNQKPTHEPIKNEANVSKLRNNRAALGMARDVAPDSATSHFYVNLKDNNYLDYDSTRADIKPGYTVFGNVTSGWAVVEAIAQSPTIPDTGGCQGRPAPSAQTVISDIRVGP